MSDPSPLAAQFDTRLATVRRTLARGDYRLAYVNAVWLGQDLQAVRAKAQDEPTRAACDSMVRSVFEIMNACVAEFRFFG